MKPLIGITSSRHTYHSKLPGPGLMGAVLSDDYATGVEAAGGLPLLIPYMEHRQSLGDLALRLDGLLLSGGDDVSPAAYGQEPHVGLGSVTPERDAIELALIEEMMARGKPILGICRGIQVLNVALGGTLYQDLPREWPGRITHSQKAKRDYLSHVVHVDPESQLYTLLGNQALVHCNSYHHQAVAQLAPALTPVAWDDEGLVEGVEHKDRPFVVGVQWHPENLWRAESAFLKLFQGFVDACAAGLSGSTPESGSGSRMEA